MTGRDGGLLSMLELRQPPHASSGLLGACRDVVRQWPVILFCGCAGLGLGLGRNPSETLSQLFCKSGGCVSLEKLLLATHTLVAAHKPELRKGYERVTQYTSRL